MADALRLHCNFHGGIHPIPEMEINGHEEFHEASGAFFYSSLSPYHIDCGLLRLNPRCTELQYPPAILRMLVGNHWKSGLSGPCDQRKAQSLWLFYRTRRFWPSDTGSFCKHFTEHQDFSEHITDRYL